MEELDKDDELSIKAKLEKLITLTREGRHPGHPTSSPPFEPLEREPLQLFENPHSLDLKYGRIPISLGLEIQPETLTHLSKDPAFESESMDLSTALFIDLETTGLSGGTGVVPFLVGLGFYRDDKFTVVQYFLGEIAEEERMIEEMSQFFSEMSFQSVVSYNGKAFDLPLLETRFILNRKPLILSEMPHLDFLFSARSLWKHKHESCRLEHLSRQIIRASRSEDIPSSEIPYLYFQYLKTGNFELMEPVLYHNQEDILSLLGLVIMGSMFFSDRADEWAEDGMDFFGVGKVFENRGEVDRSVVYFQRALEGNLSDETALLAKKKLSYHFKRKEEWAEAVSIWKEISSREKVSYQHLFSFKELAMYFEHKLKAYKEAKMIAEEGWAVSMNTASTFYERDFVYRLERLRRKIRAEQKKQVEEERNKATKEAEKVAVKKGKQAKKKSSIAGKE
jgi:uncharacterized protein YprB with RNaseH-like and TPR domain